MTWIDSPPLRACLVLNDGATTADLLPPPNTCITCHEAHGAVDTTFVQFYPKLLPIAQQKKTISRAGAF